MARMTVEELAGKIMDMLANSGMLESDLFNLNRGHYGTFYTEAKFHTEAYEYYNIFMKGMVTDTNLYGDLVEVGEVYRRNATDANQSIDISIYHWDKHDGHRLLKVRCNTNMGDKAIANKVRQVVEQYNA